MRCLSSTLALLWLVIGCRSTVKPNPSLGIQAPALSLERITPLALGEGYSCVLNKKGQGSCLGAEVKSPPAPAGWQVLRAAGHTPSLRNLVAQATVTCAVAVKPPSLENRVLCWQPQTAQTPGKKELSLRL